MLRYEASPSYEGIASKQHKPKYGSMSEKLVFKPLSDDMPVSKQHNRFKAVAGCAVVPIGCRFFLRQNDSKI